MNVKDNAIGANAPVRSGVVGIHRVGTCNINSPPKRIQRFVEKPGASEIFSDTVNTGIYILEPDVLRYIVMGREQDFSNAHGTGGTGSSSMSRSLMFLNGTS